MGNLRDAQVREETVLATDLIRSSSDSGPSAVDNKDMTGDIAARVTCQEDNRSIELVNSA
jgi:hypothetical protein